MISLLGPLGDNYWLQTHRNRLLRLPVVLPVIDYQKGCPQ